MVPIGCPRRRHAVHGVRQWACSERLCSRKRPPHRINSRIAGCFFAAGFGELVELRLNRTWRRYQSNDAALYQRTEASRQKCRADAIEVIEEITDRFGPSSTSRIMSSVERSPMISAARASAQNWPERFHSSREDRVCRRDGQFGYANAIRADHETT